MQENCSSSVAGKSVLAICDTTKVCVDSHMGRITDFEGIGILSKNQFKSSYGFLVHPLYVIDQIDGTPYGFAGVTLFNRLMETITPTISERRKATRNKPIEHKESYRWIEPCIKARREVLNKAKEINFVMDREADIWEVYERVPAFNAHVVVRSKENRCIINSEGVQTKLREQIASQEIAYSYEISLKRKGARRSKKAVLDLKYGEAQIIPSKTKESKEPLTLTYVEVKERRRRTRGKDEIIHWIIWTTRPITTKEQAKEIIEIYSKRWEIEVFFKLLKSDGFNLESSQLGSGQALRKLTLLLMESTKKILQLKSARQGKTTLKVKDVFKIEEIECLEILNKKMNGKTEKQQNPYDREHLSWACWIIARLAGWKDYYTTKNPPGNKTIKEGLEKFDTLMIGYQLTK